MLVQSTTQEEAPLLVLPFVLEEETSDTDILLEVAVVTEDDILDTIVAILCTQGQVGWHEEQLIEGVNILCSCHISKVVSGAVCILGSLYIFIRSLADATIVTLASRGLE